MIMTLQIFQHIFSYFNGYIGRRGSGNKAIYKRAIMDKGFFEFETLSFFCNDICMMADIFFCVIFL